MYNIYNMSQQYLLNWQRPKSVAIQQRPNVQQRNALIYNQNITAQTGNVIISTTNNPNLNVTGDFNMRKLLDSISFNVTYINNTSYNLSLSGKNDNGSFFGGNTNIVGPTQNCQLQCTPEYNTISATLYDNSTPPMAIASGSISVGQTAGLGCGLGAWGPWIPIFQLDLNIDGADNGSPPSSDNYWWNVLPWNGNGYNFSNITLNYNQISTPPPPCPANASFKFINNSVNSYTFVDPISGGAQITIPSGNQNFLYSIANFASGGGFCKLFLNAPNGITPWISLINNVELEVASYGEIQDPGLTYTSINMTSSVPLLNINFTSPSLPNDPDGMGTLWFGTQADPSIAPGWTSDTQFIVTFTDVTNPSV
jgi:hypothetical protein